MKYLVGAMLLIAGSLLILTKRQTQLAGEATRTMVQAYSTWPIFDINAAPQVCVMLLLTQ